jgi:hypothetical protein
MFSKVVNRNRLHYQVITVQIIDTLARYDEAFVYFQPRQIIEFSNFLGVLHDK